MRRRGGRFDDVVAGTGLRCPSPYRVLVARRPAEVVSVLAEVERVTSRGSWAYGYVGYEAAAGLEPGLAVCDTVGDGPPLVWFGLCEEPVAVAPLAPPPAGESLYTVGRWQPGWTPQRYRRDVARVRAHIAAGNTYQCNLTVRLRTQVGGDLRQLYTDLMLNQRPRYAAYLDLGKYVIASASPELLFEWVGDRLLTRPMKGTAARGRTLGEDRQRVQELLGSAKERAENIIVVDLLRNDVGRIAEIGTVSVPALCVPERYETVWQLTSDITGTLPPETDLVDIFRALFPPGSVTGAPKRRTKQIIRDLEDDPRGVYCGAIGLLAPPGAAFRARFSVAIRTVVADRGTGDAVYGTGGGITWGSDPEAEHAELWAKAAILDAPYEEFSLLETMAHDPPDGVRHLDRHLQRLASSAEYFGFPFNAERAWADISAAVNQTSASRVRLLLDRCGTLTVELGPAPTPSQRPVTLAIDLDPVDSRQRWPYHKTTRRQSYTTSAARHREADDVILVNDRGQLTETTIANLAVQLDGSWYTPPLDAGCLPGVERGYLLEYGQLHERTLAPSDLHHATALAVLSSLRGWQPAILATNPAR